MHYVNEERNPPYAESAYGFYRCRRQRLKIFTDVSDSAKKYKRAIFKLKTIKILDFLA